MTKGVDILKTGVVYRKLETHTTSLIETGFQMLAQTLSNTAGT